MWKVLLLLAVSGLLATTALADVRDGGVTRPKNIIKHSSEAATKKTVSSGHITAYRNLSPAEKAKLTERARAACRKQYGAMETLYRINYYTGEIWCRLG